MATDQSICYEFDGLVTWQAVRQHVNHDRNVHWRCLLQVSAMHEQQARLLIHSRDSPASSRLECGPHLCSCSSCMLQSCRCQNADIKMPHVTWEAVRQHINCDRNVHWRCLLQASAMCEQHMRQQARLLIHSRDSLLARSQLECGPHLCSCSSYMLQSCRCQNADVWSTTCVYMLPF